MRSACFGAPAATAAGHPERARALCDGVRRLARAGGARRLTGLSDLVRPPAPEPSAGAEAPDPVPASLTAREREVAAPVTAGLTTPAPAIAARLCLSARTVESHLGRIHRRTGVTARAALAVLRSRST
ncbi:LuxR C-terminal-related transcriptional regulator [Streptomyces sp. NPDC056491]|uniref:helix-turn-helix transcriptional regulator n=1 Tax=Streptomyces sp. NPDC056491 TaxID=3345837 RepID=UPI00367A9C6A